MRIDDEGLPFLSRSEGCIVSLEGYSREEPDPTMREGCVHLGNCTPIFCACARAEARETLSQAIAN